MAKSVQGVKKNNKKVIEDTNVPSLVSVKPVTKRSIRTYLNVQEIGSNLNEVKLTLQNLIFKRNAEFEKEVRVKRIYLSLASLVLLVVLGVVISKKSQAEVAMFYPTSCLGGWSNLSKATGKPDTDKENGFSNLNSAILPENTTADLFCGGFVGDIPPNKDPKLLVLRITWSTEGSTSTKEAPGLLDMIEGGSFASSSGAILDAPASSSPSFTLTEDATSTEIQIEEVATTTETQTQVATTTETFPKEVAPQEIIKEETKPKEESISTPASAPEVAPSPQTSVEQNPQPEIVPEVIPTPETQAPQSSTWLPKLISFLKVFSPYAYAQEQASSSETTLPPVVVKVEAPIDVQTTATVTPMLITEPIIGTVATSTQADVPIDTPVVESKIEIIEDPLTSPVNTPEIASSTDEIIENKNTSTVDENNPLTAPINTPEIETLTSTSTSEIATSTLEIATSTEITSTTTVKYPPFFEVEYTLDGITWTPLGGVALEELKATQFGIPIPENASWDDLSKLQIHIKRVENVDNAPTVFLDGITLEVEVVKVVPVELFHPDFIRDTILRDVTENGMRIVTIINADTQEEEIWYMYLDEDIQISATSTDSTATSSPSSATTTNDAQSVDITTDSLSLASSSEIINNASSTSTSTSTEFVVLQIKQKNVWKKYVGDIVLPTSKDIVVQENVEARKDTATTTEEIQEEDLILDLVSDLTKDKIRRIKGVFVNSIIVQIIGNTKDELWLYDAENETQQKLESGTSTTVSPEYPFGIKGGFIFWLSSDETIVYAYNPTTKVFLEKTVPLFDATVGERAEINFEGIPWKVIISKEGFTFFNREYGEVFSDEDSKVQDALRKKFNLDTILSTEKLNKLDFSIEQSKEETP